MKLFGSLTLLALWTTLIVGWLANIWQVAVMAYASAPVTTLFIAKIVAIFLGPVGSIFGLVGLFN